MSRPKGHERRCSLYLLVSISFSVWAVVGREPTASLPLDAEGSFVEDFAFLLARVRPIRIVPPKVIKAVGSMTGNSKLSSGDETKHEHKNKL